MFSARDPSDIDRFFRGLTEYAFHARLGVVDPPLVDYVALLLVRHLRLDRVANVPGVGDDEPPEVANRLMVAQRHASVDDAREEYRRIGDATLFWSGVYPEAVRRFERPGRPESLIGYREAGKRAYWLVASLEPDDAAEERRLFERLCHEYDLCVEGLAEVRRAWGEAA
jgi:hypothetical protein